MALNKKVLADTFDRKLLEKEMEYTRGEVTKEYMVKFIQNMMANCLDLNLGDTARRYNEKLGSM